MTKPLSIGLILMATTSSIAQAQDQTASPASVEELVVIGRAEQYYLRSTPSLGSKFPGELKDVPQSIQILPRQLIEDQQAVEITDLYRNISSVSIFSYSGVTFRGFRQDEIRYDGLLGDPFSGFSVPLLFDIEQVEIIKGPSGALFGGGEPGGVINYVTRAPSPDASGYVRAVGGRYDLFGFRSEITGPLDQAGTLLYRVGAAYENTDTFRFNTNKEDIVLAADLTWRPDARTSLSFKFDYIDQDFQGARLRGVPVDDDGEFLTSRRFNTNETTDFQRLEALAFTLDAQRQLTDAVKLRLAGRAVISQEKQEYHEPRGLFVNAQGVLRMRREFRDQLRDIDQYTALAEVTHEGTLAGMKSQWLVGGEYYRVENRDFFLTSSDSRRANILPPNFIVPDINLVDPDFGNSNPSLFDPLQELDREGAFDQWGIYIQNHLQVTQRLALTVGGRLEGFSENQNSTTTILLTNAVSQSQARQSDEKLTYRFGAVYDWTDDLATYFNISSGFSPQSAASQEADSGGPFGPETGRLLELGLKTTLLDGALFIQSAIYQINKQDVLVADPTPGAPVGALANIGEARARGFELDVVGDLSTAWTLAFNYAYNDTKILEGDDEITNAVGNRFANAPRHQLGFWTRYDIDIINSALTFGGDYVAKRLSLSGQRVDPYMVFDAGWQTQWDNIQLQVNVRNLFDKVYAESGFIARTGHFPGEPRTFRAEVTYAF